MGFFIGHGNVRGKCWWYRKALYSKALTLIFLWEEMTEDLLPKWVKGKMCQKVQESSSHPNSHWGLFSTQFLQGLWLRCIWTWIYRCWVRVTVFSSPFTMLIISIFFNYLWCFRYSGDWSRIGVISKEV